MTYDTTGMTRCEDFDYDDDRIWIQYYKTFADCPLPNYAIVTSMTSDESMEMRRGGWAWRYSHDGTTVEKHGQEPIDVAVYWWRARMKESKGVVHFGAFDFQEEDYSVMMYGPMGETLPTTAVANMWRSGFLILEHSPDVGWWYGARDGSIEYSHHDIRKCIENAM